MVIYESTDIWTTQAEAIVIPVNCVGVMGKGLALQCKQRYQQAFETYRSFCSQNMIRIGETRVIPTHEKPLIVLPTKNHYMQPSFYTYISLGLESLVENNHVWQFQSIALPKLGCGEGSLVWESKNGVSVKKICERILTNTACSYYIHL